MKEIFDKLSSYNLFNYLLPGVVFVIVAKQFTGYDFIQKDLAVGAFAYYFIGMVISRFGSVIVEPILRGISFVKFSDYKRFIPASKKDEKINLLSEVNNTYRTLISMFLVLGLLKLYHWIEEQFHLTYNLGYYIGGTILLITFLFAYRKQTTYITERVDAAS
jgi:hypothetical protein